VNIYADAGEHDKAIAECQAALTAAGPASTAVFKTRLAELHAGKGDLQPAREMMEQLAAEASGPARSAARLKLARILLEHHREDQARHCLLKVVSEDQGNMASRMMLLAMKPNEQAAPSRQQLVDQLKRIEGEGGLNWRYWQARIWIELDDWAGYRADIEALLGDCLAQDPDWAEAALALGLMHEKAGEAGEAMTVYRRAWQANPRHLELGRRLLTLAAREEQWAEVDRLLDLLPPDEPALQSYRVRRALREGDTDRAVELLEARIEADATDFMSRLQLAAVLSRQKDPARAERLVADAAQIAPDAFPVLTARVEACLSRSEFQQALSLCDQALAAGASPQVHALRARVHEVKGDLARAEGDLREVIQAEGMTEKGYLAL